MPRNHQKSHTTGTDRFGASSTTTQHRTYRSHAASLTLTQPLFSYEAWTRYKMGVVQTLMADKRYRTQLTEVASRVITGYLDVVFAEDKLSLARQQRQMLENQLAHTQRMIAAGEGSRTDLEETRARYALVRVDVLEAEDSMVAVRRELEVITGTSIEDTGLLQRLRPAPFSVPPLNPVDIAGWQRLALNNNPVLAGSRYSAEAAKLEIAHNRAGFMLEVQLYAALCSSMQLYAAQTRNDFASDNTINQAYNPAVSAFRSACRC